MLKLRLNPIYTSSYRDVDTASQRLLGPLRKNFNEFKQSSVIGPASRELQNPEHTRKKVNIDSRHVRNYESRRIQWCP